MKASWLYSKSPLVVDKDLATVIGLNEAIILQQINYWLHVRGGKDVDSRHWIKHTISEFLEKDFPFWSRSTVKRAIINCKKKGFLLERNLNTAGFDKSKWYSIDEDKLNEVMSHALVQNEPTSGSKWTNGKVQNEPTYTREYTKNTTEITTNNNKSSSKDEHIPYSDIIDYLNQQTGQALRPTTKAYRKLIRARWGEGYRLKDFKTVIDNKKKEWQGTKFWGFMTPKTLFTSGHFNTYLNANKLEANSNRGGGFNIDEEAQKKFFDQIDGNDLPF